MATLEEITDHFKAAVAAGGRIQRPIKFDLKGEGFIHIAGDQVSNDDAPADCTFVVSRDDFGRIAKGELDPAAAMMRGRLKVRGDMSLALSLQPLLSAAKEMIR